MLYRGIGMLYGDCENACVPCSLRTSIFASNTSLVDTGPTRQKEKTPPKRGLCVYDSTAGGGIFNLSDGRCDPTVDTIRGRSMHRDPFRCQYGFLRQREFQHAVVVLGLDGRFVDLMMEREHALEFSVIALGAKHRHLAVLGVF